MDIRCRLTLVLLLVNSSLLHAATEFEITVPVNLARYLSGGGIAYSDLPDDFPAFVMPEGLLPIGSQDGNYQQLVLLRTNRGGAESQAAVVQALMAGGGWMTLAPLGSPRQNGFVIPAVGLQPVSLCHDELGELEIRGEGEDPAENRVYIRRLKRASQPNWEGCAAMNEGRASLRPSLRSPEASIIQYMPSFAFLEEPAASDQRSFAPLSGSRIVRDAPTNSPALGIRGIAAPVPMITRSNSALESRLSIPANGRSAKDINDIVIAQLQKDGWASDTIWNGNAGAGSNWVRTPEADVKLFLSVLVMATGSEKYEARIKLIKLP